MAYLIETALASILLFTSAMQDRDPVAPPADHPQYPQAQPQQGRLQAGSYNIKVDVNSVLLNASVRDRRTNRTIPNLGKDDFLLYEDGVLQKVDQLISGDAPFFSLLLIDNSGSTREFLPLMKESAMDFVNRLKPEDQVAVASFNSLVNLEQDFTDDRDLLAKAIRKIDSIGGTAFYDALLTCIDRYSLGITGRTAIIVFTDGVDNRLEGPNSEGSRTDFSDLYRRVQEADQIIYTIFLDTPTDTPSAGAPRTGPQWPFPGPFPGPWPIPRNPQRQPKPDRTEIHAEAQQQLWDIADQTGGRMYRLTDIQDLSKIYREILDDLRSQYVIAYTPNRHTADSEWHEIKVRVKNRTDIAVRTRKGYYAQQRF
jgi:VWFA-related protein